MILETSILDNIFIKNYNQNEYNPYSFIKNDFGCAFGCLNLLILLISIKQQSNNIFKFISEYY